MKRGKDSYPGRKRRCETDAEREKKKEKKELARRQKDQTARRSFFQTTSASADSRGGSSGPETRPENNRSEHEHETRNDGASTGDQSSKEHEGHDSV